MLDQTAIASSGVTGSGDLITLRLHICNAVRRPSPSGLLGLLLFSVLRGVDAAALLKLDYLHRAVARYFGWVWPEGNV
jgi:hypothetical protein